MVGLGCRSLTILVYAGAQVVLMILWVIDWLCWDQEESSTGISWTIATFFWYCAFLPAVFLGFFAGIIGTRELTLQQ